MDDLGSRIKHVTRELKDYVETRLELILLNFSEKITYWIGQSIQQLIGYTILGIGIVFGMNALAIYLGEILDASWAGYVIVASPFVLLGLIFVIAKPKFISRSIQNQILGEVLDSFNSNHEPDSLKQLPSKEKYKKESEKNG